MLYVVRLFRVMLLFSANLCFAENNTDIKQYLEYLENNGEVNIPKEIAERVNKAEAIYHSREFQDKVKAKQNQLKKILSLENNALNKKRPTDNLDRPLLFISASIPLSVLRKYAEQLHAAGGGTMILKGFIGGSKTISPTLKFIATIINIDTLCKGSACEKYKVDIIIDPVLFKQHKIDRVPAFTVYESNTYTERCRAGHAVENARIIFGDASLKGLALELANSDTRQSVKRFIAKAGYQK